MLKKIFSLQLILMLVLANAHAQSQQDIQLAQEYLKNGDYDKAASLYDKLLSKSPGNTVYYQSCLTSLTALKQYDDAEKMIKRQIKKFPHDLTYYVDLGDIYALKGDSKAAEAQYAEAIKNIEPDMQQISQLANKFKGSNLTDKAIETFLNGKKILNAENSDLFDIDLAALYTKNNDPVNTIKTYLDMVEYNPSQEDFVEGELQPLIEIDAFSKELQSSLYKRIQKNPDREDFSEMLIWYFVQKKDFASGFLQVKALDKRNREDGQRVFQFGQSAYDEGYYDAALLAYRYIITEKGKNNMLYQPARASELRTEQTKLTVQNNYTADDLKKLEATYESYFSEFGKNGQTLPVLRDYANFEARYMHNLDQSISLLNEAINIQSNDLHLKGNLKLDLGDDYLIDGKIWDAMLLYGQVDKAFKDDPLGELARFKNASLSYHIGDFDWAKAQLDVLKGSTTELIANDALALSVFIQDNMGLDTTPEPMKMYARADLLIFQNKLPEALVTLDSLMAKYPNHSLADDVLFEKGRILMQQKKYTDAAAMFEQVDKNYPTDLLADDALFELAQLYENYLNDKNKAMDLYKQLLLNYKGSIYVIEARKKFRELRGDQPN